MIIFHMVRLMMEAVRGVGGRSRISSLGGSVESESAARESLIGMSKMMGGRCEELNLHEQVYPEELDGSENGAHFRVLDCRDEGDYHGGDVDRDLKLEELLHGVVHSTTPH